MKIFFIVIHDRLLGEETLEAIKPMEAKVYAECFTNLRLRYHGFPNSTISERDSNWVERFWKRLVNLWK